MDNRREINSLNQVKETFKDAREFGSWKSNIERIFQEETLRLGLGYTFDDLLRGGEGGGKDGQRIIDRIICSVPDCGACREANSLKEDLQQVKQKQEQEFASEPHATLPIVLLPKQGHDGNELACQDTPSNLESEKKKLISSSLIHPHCIQIESLPSEVEAALQNNNSPTLTGGDNINGHRNKEILQHMSIAGHLLKNNLLNKDTVLVEVGCGKGDLSLSLSRCLKGLGQFSCVEPRPKLETEEILIPNQELEETFNVQTSTDQDVIRVSDNQIKDECAVGSSINRPPVKRKRTQETLQRKYRRMGDDLEDNDISGIPIQFILLDRKIHRRKKDNLIRLNHPQLHSQNINENVLVKRLKQDIRHYDFHQEEALENKHFVCYSKHFCGAATDLLIRQVESTCHRDGLSSCDSSRATKRFRGYFICLCCHHQCNWDDYIYKQYFTDRMSMSGLDFTRMKWLAAWGVNQFRDEAQENISEVDRVENLSEDSKDLDFFTSFSIPEKIKLGFMCKRLIDYGRIEFLRGKGYRCELVQYVDPRVTPECYLLKAIPMRDPE